MSLPLNEEAERLISGAKDMARYLHDSCVMTDHLLLAIAEDGNRNKAGVALINLGVNLFGLSLEIKRTTESAEKKHSSAIPLVLTPSFERVIERAKRFVSNSGGKAVGSEHLLFGLLEEEGGPQQMLNQRGIELNDLVNNISA